MPKVIKEPNDEVVTLEDVKSFLKITNIEDDGILNTLIKAARKTIEQFTSKVFLSQEQEITINCSSLNFSLHDELNNCDVFVTMPVSPIQKIISVKVINNTSESLIKNFKLVNFGTYYKLLLNSNLINKYSILKIGYIAGFKNPSDVPEPLKVATIMLINDMYKEKDISTQERVSRGVRYLIRPYCNVAI